MSETSTKARRSLLRARAAATLLVVAAGLCGLSRPAGAAECRFGVLELPVKMVGSRPIVMLGLNGTQVPMLVDTGAFYSMLTDAAASQLQLRTRALPEGFRLNGFTGSVRARLTKVDKVQLSTGTIPDVEFITGLNEIGGGAMGLIGRNFLSVTDSEFDLAHGVIRLVKPKGDCDDTNMAYWAKDEAVNVVPLASIRDQANAFLVNVSVNGDKQKALLDTGAPESGLLLSAAKSAGIKEPDMTPSDLVGGGGSGHAKSWVANVATIDVGGERVMHNKLRVVDTDWVQQGVILGIDYFLSHRIYIARSQDRMYATWNGGPIFVQNAAAHDAATAGQGTEPAPADADGLLRRGAAFASRKDFAHALADLDKACALAPQDANCFATRARVRLATTDVDGAARDLDEALRLDPAAADPRMDRATLRAARGNHDGALADLRALDAALPPQANLRAAMASTYAELDLPDDALRQWDTWTARHLHDGNLSLVLNARCWMRVRYKRELDKALADCREAVDDSPDQANFHGSLGWVLERRGEHAKAIKEFDTAIALQAKSPWSFYGRGLAHLRQGEKAAADADLARARALSDTIDAQARRNGMSVD